MGGTTNVGSLQNCIRKIYLVDVRQFLQYTVYKRLKDVFDNERTAFVPCVFSLP